MKDKAAIAALAALAQEDRLAAFRLLVQAGPEGMASSEIADRLSVPPTRMSFHLAALERSRLVTSRRKGRWIYYAVCLDRMRSLLGFLTEDCCYDRPETCGVPAPANKEDQ